MNELTRAEYQPHEPITFVTISTMSVDYTNKVGFAIGTGRCGTLFLHQAVDLEPTIASSHERNPDNEAFHRYCKWNALPVDDEGFLATKEREIQSDLATHAYSFEASPYLSLSVRELHDQFGARFLLLIRRPDGVVTSFVHKGFYRRPYAVRNPDLAVGYQDQNPEKMHAFLARVAPKGEFLRTWNDMTQVGRVAWFWRAWNERTIEMLEQLPKESYRIIRIEDLDFEAYRQSCDFLGFSPSVTEADFNSLRESKPHAFWRKRHVDRWTDQEAREFEGQVAELADQFGYEHRITNLAEHARAERADAERLGHISPTKRGPRFWRLRKTTATWLRGLATHLDAR